jgi:hypothetical protein
MLRHPERDCIYSEAQASLHMEKYRTQPIEAQVQNYRGEGYPSGNGLLACTVIARSADVDLKEIENKWWAENKLWTYQDQLSLPVVLWRTGQEVDIVDKDLWDNTWFDWVQHKSLY